MADYWNDGEINWFSPSDLTKSGSMFITSSGKKISRLGLAGSSAKLFPPYSVMMTSRATLGVISINTKPACTNQGFIICVPNEKLSTWQIVFWLQENLEMMISLATGATFKEITRGVFRKLPILVPPNFISEQFNSAVEPMFKQIECLLNKQAMLRSTRDLLLPKLISGQIDVEHLDIDTVATPEEAES